MSREYVNIKLLNPKSSKIDGVPIDELPKIQRYNGRFQLNDHVLIPITGETKVRFSNISLDCSLDAGLFAALEGGRPFHLHEEGTGRELAVLRIVKEPTKVSFLDEVMATKSGIAAYMLAAKAGEVASYLFK